MADIGKDGNSDPHEYTSPYDDTEIDKLLEFHTGTYEVNTDLSEYQFDPIYKYLEI